MLAPGLAPRQTPRPGAEDWAADTDEAYPREWLGAHHAPIPEMSNPPTADSGRYTDVSASLAAAPANTDDNAYIGQPIQPPAPGPITFEDPAMAAAHLSAGVARDRQIEQERADGWRS